jgi:hypothetical protein
MLHRGDVRVLGLRNFKLYIFNKKEPGSIALFIPQTGQIVERDRVGT